MPILWKDACLAVGFNKDALGPPPVYAYFGYRDGIAFQTTDESVTFDSPPERVTVNSTDIFQFKRSQGELEIAALQLFNTSLRSAHPELPDVVYNVCYRRTYREVGYADYDKFAQSLETRIKFVNEILESLANA